MLKKPVAVQREATWCRRVCAHGRSLGWQRVQFYLGVGASPQAKVGSHKRKVLLELSCPVRSCRVTVCATL